MVKKILLYRFPYKCMGRMIPIQSSTRSIEEKRPIAAMVSLGVAKIVVASANFALKLVR